MATLLGSTLNFDFQKKCDSAQEHQAFLFSKEKKGVKLSYVHMFVFLYCVFSRFHLMERNPYPNLRNILRSRWGYSPINLSEVSLLTKLI